MVYGDVLNSSFSLSGNVYLPGFFILKVLESIIVINHARIKGKISSELDLRETKNLQDNKDIIRNSKFLCLLSSLLLNLFINKGITEKKENELLVKTIR